MQFVSHAIDATTRATSLAAAGRFGREAAAGARVIFASLPEFTETPLLVMPDLALALGVASVALKDERTRLGLGSFKGLGGAYAVFTLTATADGVDCNDPAALAAFVAARRRGSAAAPSGLTVTTATAGNHGRSVAVGASMMGIDCVIYVYDDVPEEQINAIAAHGARIVRVRGVYEDAVERCRIDAEQAGWLVVSDTSWTGYTELPSRIMEGYTVMAAEALKAMSEPPTHIMLQAGVGGMAAAVAAHAALEVTEIQPKLIIVEPAAAACLFASAREGALATVPHGRSSNMGRLDCYTPSLIAWEILRGLADCFVTVTNEEALEAVDMLQAAGVETSPSGAAGFAGLVALRSQNLCDLDANSRVLAFVTECRPQGSIRKSVDGATEPVPMPGSVGKD